MQLDDRDAFCMTYTGGTTGRPKGVLMNHRARNITAHTVAFVGLVVICGAVLIVTTAVASALLQPSTEVTRFEYVPAPAPVGTVMLVLDVVVVKMKLLGPFTK